MRSPFLWPRSFLLLFVLGLAASPAMAQAPVVDAVLNNASYSVPPLPSSGIAQGSIFAVFGKNLGPANLVLVDRFPLPTSGGLAGTSVTATSGSTTLDCIMLYTLAGQVGAVLPSATPVGDVTIRVTYNGQTSAPFPIKVVRSAFGIFTQNSRGTGPAAIQNWTPTVQPLNLLTKAARPRQVVILWGTGLGPLPTDLIPLEEKQANPRDLPIDVEVYVGGKRANVTYRGRSGCCVGVDQIVFEVPDGVEGCYQQVVVKIGNIVSNYATMSISSTGEECAAEGGTITPERLRAAQARGWATYACMTLYRECEESFLPSEGETCEDGLTASFGKADIGVLDLSGFYGDKNVGACTVYTFAARLDSPPPDFFPISTLDAGTLLVNGPKGPREVRRRSEGNYHTVLGGGENNLPLYLDPGTYTIDNGPGTTQVGPFQIVTNFPEDLNWTNKASISSIDRAQGQEVTWTGGDPSAFVVISGQSVGGTETTGVVGWFVCRERNPAGRFFIPPAVLLSLPTMEFFGFPLVNLTVGQAGPLQEILGTGLDSAAFEWRLTHGKPVEYR